MEGFPRTFDPDVMGVSVVAATSALSPLLVGDLVPGTAF